MYLKASPVRGLHRFKVKGKLSPRFIGPYKIVARKGEVAYQLELPEQLSDVHDVFHVSQLKRCLKEPEEKSLPLEELDVSKKNHLLFVASKRLFNNSVKCFKHSPSSVSTFHRRCLYISPFLLFQPNP